jgi:hypothetical protein
MQRATVHVTFEEFAHDLDRFFDRVAYGQETVVVEGTAGAQIVVRPARARLRPPTRTPDDLSAFIAAAGSWSDVDDETLMRQIYQSRDLPPRPPVDL